MEAFQKLQTQKNTSDSHNDQTIVQAYNELQAHYSPELAKVEKEIATFQTRNKLSAHELSEDQKNQMTKDFAAIHEKYKDVYVALGELMNNPEYQHKSQLLAEQFKDNQNSSEYMQAIIALRCDFIPGLKNHAGPLNYYF